MRLPRGWLACFSDGLWTSSKWCEGCAVLYACLSLWMHARTPGGGFPHAPLSLPRSRALVRLQSRLVTDDAFRQLEAYYSMPTFPRIHSRVFLSPNACVNCGGGGGDAARTPALSVESGRCPGLAVPPPSSARLTPHYMSPAERRAEKRRKTAAP